MNTDTPIPRTDEWETYCDESYYRLWRVRRKNERGFNDGYHVHNGDEARALVDLLNKQDSELISARAEIERLDTAGIHSCHDNCQRPNCVLRRELKAVTEQLKNAQAELLKSCLREQLYHEDYKAEKNRADDALLELNAVTEQRDRLADLVRQFISILDITEESDSGRLFHFTNITSCRAGDLQKAGELVEALRRASR